MIHKLRRMLQSNLARLGRQAGRQADREEKVLEKKSVIAWSHAECCPLPPLLQEA